MSARPQDSALDELRFLSSLHRVTEADLDARIAERPTISPKHRHLVETPKGILIGSAYTPPPAPMFDEARRVQKLVLRAAATDGEYRDPSPWVREAEISAAEDEHSQAMAATPLHASAEPKAWGAKWARAIVLATFFGLLAVVACDYFAWSHVLPGSQP